MKQGERRGGTEGIGRVHEKGKTTTAQSGDDTNLYKQRRGRMTRVEEVKGGGRMRMESEERNNLENLIANTK